MPTTTKSKGRPKGSKDSVPMSQKERARRRHKQTMDGDKRIVEFGNGTKQIHRPGMPMIFVDSQGRGHIRIGKTTVALLAGEEDPATWTDEELLRGAPMRIGKTPLIIPLQVYQELVNRMQSQARYRFVAELSVAIDKHMAIIHGMDPADPTAVQWAAIKELYDRVLGKPEETVKIGLDMANPFMKMVAEAIVGNEEQAREVLDVTPSAEDGDAGGKRLPAKTVRRR